MGWMNVYEMMEFRVYFRRSLFFFLLIAFFSLTGVTQLSSPYFSPAE